MGSHYVSQEHLRGFQIPDRPGFIWMYDRQADAWSEAAIAKVAQRPGYYAPKVEKALADYVERPGHRALNLLREGHAVEGDDRAALAVYMAVAYSRVPKQARKKIEMAPEYLPGTLHRLRSEIEALGPQIGATRLSELLAQIDRVGANYEGGLPPQLVQELQHPHISEKAARSILEMTWRLVPAVRSHSFVTTDNPLFFFPSLGVGNADSEITFPLSRDLVLVGCRRGPPGGLLAVPKPTPFLLREVNRRMVSEADRFIFSPHPHTWVRILARKRSLRLTRIRW